MKNNLIYVDAYFKQNLGDDMFVDLLTRMFPEYKYYLFCEPCFSRAFQGNSRCIIPSQITYRFYYYLSEIFGVQRKNFFAAFLAKVNVLIGGSVFIEPTEWKARNRKYKNNGKQFYIGCNFGPYKHNSFYRDVYNRLLNIMSIYFRDKYSYGMFSTLPNVHYAPDCLFSYPYKKYQKDEKLIGISVIDFARKTGLENMTDKYYSTLADLIKAIKNKGFRVRLLSFCVDEGDTKAVGQLLEKVDDSKDIEIREYVGNIENFLESIGQCQCVFSTRFHGMIIGWSMGKNVVPIIYSDKQRTVIDDIGYKGLIWDAREERNTDSIDLWGEIMNNEVPNVDVLKERSKEQFSSLRCFLEGRNKNAK